MPFLKWELILLINCKANKFVANTAMTAQVFGFSFALVIFPFGQTKIFVPTAHI